MKMNLNFNVIFQHSDKYINNKVTTVILNRLLLAEGGSKVNFPLGILTIKKNTESPEALFANSVFELKMLTNIVC